MIYDDLKKRGDENPEVLQIRKEINEDKIYERYFPIDKGDVVVDIGAHVGVFSDRAVTLGAEVVYALEPDPLFFKQLLDVQVVKHSGIPRIRKFNLAVGSFNGPSIMKSDGHANIIGSGDTDIHVTTFKSFVEDYDVQKIDFLKIDCEGGEYDVFTEENIQWIAKNCKKIVFELHIYNMFQRAMIPMIFDCFERYNIDFVVTSLDGVNIGKNFNRNYFTEVLVYATTPVYGKIEQKVDAPIISHNFVNGAYIEVKGSSKSYHVSFSDDKKVIHESDVVGHGGWAKCYQQYYTPYHITVTDNVTKDIVFEHDLDLEGKRVVVELTSKALGDTIAWFPYVEEFRKKHNCEVTVVTFHNHLFEKVYPNLIFAEPGSVVNNVYAWYTIGWFYKDGRYDGHRNPYDPKAEPLQQTASDILGLKYKEIVPKLAFSPGTRPISNKYICIANHGSSQAKYWNNPDGWQKVVEYLKSNGYDVVLLSKEKDGHNGNFNPSGVIYPEDYNIHRIMNLIYHSELFIGIGSGLSWLAWALQKQVVLISGFSESYTEMRDCIRVIGGAPCHGCFNWVQLQNDGDWNWCPRYKGTDRQFECTKSITGQDVIRALPL